MKEKQKQSKAIIIYGYDKIPQDLKYKVIGKVHGYCALKNGMNKNLANLDMKRDAIEKHGTNVDAIISTQYSYYGGYYGKGGTNVYGLAIEILDESQLSSLDFVLCHTARRQVEVL